MFASLHCANSAPGYGSDRPGGAAGSPRAERETLCGRACSWTRITPIHRHLVLIGYRGTGKSTLAPWLGAALHCPVVDTDLLIADREGRTIAEIFRDQGESHFRDLETQALRGASQSEPRIISTGGGIVLREENRQLLRQTYVVWLRAPVETLWQRLQTGPAAAQRPALTSLPPLDEIHQLLAVREPLYAACAHFTVDTDRFSPQDSVDLIVRHLSRDPAWT